MNTKRQPSISLIEGEKSDYNLISMRPDQAGLLNSLCNASLLKGWQMAVLLPVVNIFSTIDENAGFQPIIIENVLVGNIDIRISRHSHSGRQLDKFLR